MRIQSLAAQTCERISKWHKEKPDRFASLKASIKKGLKKPSVAAVKTVSKVICPTYFTFDKQYMVSVAKRYACEEKQLLEVWCTTSFRHYVFGGTSQFLLPEPDPTHNFQLLVERMLPAYSEVFPYEYHVGNLLRGNRMCLDLAFLEAVWRYSRKVGETFFNAATSRRLFRM